MQQVYSGSSIVMNNNRGNGSRGVSTTAAPITRTRGPTPTSPTYPTPASSSSSAARLGTTRSFSSCGDPPTPGNQQICDGANNSSDNATRTPYTMPSTTTTGAVPPPAAASTGSSVPIMNTTTTYTLRSTTLGASTSLLSVSSSDGVAGLPLSSRQQQQQQPGTPQQYCHAAAAITPSHRQHNVARSISATSSRSVTPAAAAAAAVIDGLTLSSGSGGVVLVRTNNPSYSPASGGRRTPALGECPVAVASPHLPTPGYFYEDHHGQGQTTTVAAARPAPSTVVRSMSLDSTAQHHNQLPHKAPHIMTAAAGAGDGVVLSHVLQPMLDALEKRLCDRMDTFEKSYEERIDSVRTDLSDLINTTAARLQQYSDHSITTGDGGEGCCCHFPSSSSTVSSDIAEEAVADDDPPPVYCHRHPSGVSSDVCSSCCPFRHQQHHPSSHHHHHAGSRGPPGFTAARSGSSLRFTEDGDQESLSPRLEEGLLLPSRGCGGGSGCRWGCSCRVQQHPRGYPHQRVARRQSIANSIIGAGKGEVPIWDLMDGPVDVMAPPAPPPAEGAAAHPMPDAAESLHPKSPVKDPQIQVPSLRLPVSSSPSSSSSSSSTSMLQQYEAAETDRRRIRKERKREKAEMQRERIHQRHQQLQHVKAHLRHLDEVLAAKRAQLFSSTDSGRPAPASGAHDDIRATSMIPPPPPEIVVDQQHHHQKDGVEDYHPITSPTAEHRRAEARE